MDLEALPYREALSRDLGQLLGRSFKHFPQ